MIEWHHQLDGHEFEQGLGVGNGQGSLVTSIFSSIQHALGNDVMFLN